MKPGRRRIRARRCARRRAPAEPVARALARRRRLRQRRDHVRGGGEGHPLSLQDQAVAEYPEAVQDPVRRQGMEGLRLRLGGAGAAGQARRMAAETPRAVHTASRREEGRNRREVVVMRRKQRQERAKLTNLGYIKIIAEPTMPTYSKIGDIVIDSPGFARSKTNISSSYRLPFDPPQPTIRLSAVHLGNL